MINLIRFGFRLLYNELAFTYDLISWAVSLGQWREWQRTALPFLHGQKILELAHGPGHMLLELEKAGFLPTGLDLSPFMGRIAYNRIGRHGISIPLIQGQGQALPFASGSFTSVLATFPSEFIIESETLLSAWRTLLPGGRIVIVIGAQLTGGGVATSIIEWLYTITGLMSGSKATIDQAGIWNLARERLSAAGFDPEIEQVLVDRSLVTLLIGQRRE